jgi:hypothetical protein
MIIIDTRFQIENRRRILKLDNQTKMSTILIISKKMLMFKFKTITIININTEYRRLRHLMKLI